MQFAETTATRRILELQKKIRAVQGGTSASKTVSILLALIALAQTDKTPTLTSVVSESLPHLKRGALRDFQNILKGHLYWKEDNWKESDKIYTFETGSQIEFFGADSADKLRGGRRDRLFINEANNVTLDVFDQLEVRTKDFVFIDWNPSTEYWFYTDVLNKREDVDHIILTYKDNEALSKEIIQSIEARKHNKSWWRVYGEGQLGEVEGRIYTGWNIVDEIPAMARLERRGLDYGYSVDPTAIVDVYKYNEGYVLDEICYRKGMSNKDIADFLKNQPNPQTYVVPDSAEPKSNDELHLYGINILPAQKGPGSISQGIQLVQSKPIMVTKRSVNLIKEYRNYLWDTDKEGRMLQIPVPGSDHCFVGSTMIETNRGSMPIADVREGDMVLTSRGYRTVLKVHDNGIKRVSSYVLHTDMSLVHLMCTSDHKVKTHNTWTPISQLQPGQQVSLFKLFSGDAIHSTQESVTSQVGQSGYTGSYTNIFTAKSRKECTFITKMGILRTITQTISNWYLRVLTYLTIVAEMLSGSNLTSSHSESRLQKNGMRHQKALNGIQSMAKNLGSVARTKNTHADSAGGHSSLGTVDLSNFVITTAKLVRCEKGEEWNERVYDLTIDGQHEYFANGILVHNCLDSIRYAIQSIHPVAYEPSGELRIY